MSPPRILFVDGSATFLISHRLPLMAAARAEGYEVHCACPPLGDHQSLIDAGYHYHPTRMIRGGLNPVRDAYAFMSLLRLYRRLRPDLIHHITIKPVTYGGIAAFFTRQPAVSYAVSGLGRLFISKRWRDWPVRMLGRTLYRMAFLPKNKRVVFQNEDDRRTICRIGKIANEDTVIFNGSGVDISQFEFTPEPVEKETVVLFVARLLKDKGIIEFLAAAAKLLNQGVAARFVIAGDVDPFNPATMTKTEIDAWSAHSGIEFLGNRTDVAELMSAANLVVLPSYREGFPKVLMEASAAGRAIVTTDTPGCRDAISPNETGLLVPVADADALATAIKELIDGPARREEMGRRGRQLAEEKYDLQIIVKQHLKLFAELLTGAGMDPPN